MWKDKRSVIIPFSLVFLFASTAAADNWFTRIFGAGVKGSGDLVTEERDLDTFTEIESEGSMDVRVRPGEKQEVLVRFDDNLIDLIKTEVEGSTLYIHSKGRYRSRHTCRLEITVSALERVTTRGSGDIDVSGFTSDVFDCCTRGSGDISIRDLTCGELRCDIGGSGDIALRNFQGELLECRIDGSGNIDADGLVNEIEIRVSGSGDVDARDLRAKAARVVSRGSGDVRVWAEESLEGSVHGSGDISYYGDPESVSKDVHGSGSIRRQ
ncbi:MAG: head GIN domain-containing protein [Candidatus Zixiibacteriota bacterium]